MSKLIIDSRGKLFFEDAQIIFQNFSGRETGYNGQIYNREGDRNFCIIIDDPEDAQKLADLGWHVKYRAGSGRDPQDPGQYRLKVNVNYGGRTKPTVIKHDGERAIELTEETVGSLDGDDIEFVHCSINPWKLRDGTGYSAYLDTLHAIVKGDPFQHKFAHLDTPEVF